VNAQTRRTLTLDRWLRAGRRVVAKSAAKELGVDDPAGRKSMVGIGIVNGAIRSAPPARRPWMAEVPCREISGSTPISLARVQTVMFKRPFWRYNLSQISHWQLRKLAAEMGIAKADLDSAVADDQVRVEHIRHAP
jgi:hypothetical protein